MFKYKRDVTYLPNLIYIIYIYLVSSLRVVLINLFLQTFICFYRKNICCFIIALICQTKTNLKIFFNVFNNVIKW